MVDIIQCIISLHFIININIGVQLELSYQGTPIEDLLVLDCDDESVKVTFPDVETATGELWEIEASYEDATGVMKCDKSAGSCDLMFSGSTEVEVEVTATSQQTGKKKKKPVMIVIGPVTQPS